MANLNLLMFLQTYSDSSPSNAPNLSNFRWTRELDSMPVSNPFSQAYQVAPGQTLPLFSGSRSLAQDSTTVYSLALAPFQTSIYQLSYVSGTAPSFRTLRSIGTDATSEVTASTNGPVVTFTFSGGTLPSLTSVQVGDNVLIGNAFNPLNQGQFSIISLTTNSISIVNSVGYNEGPITLGSSFATQLRIFSSDGVQVNDTLTISGGFSPVSQGSYLVTAVTDSYVQFSSSEILPQESNIMTDAISVYSVAKSLVYVESDQKITLLINGAVSGPYIEPFVNNNSITPGIFLLNSTIYSLAIVNNSINMANIYMAAVE